MARITVNCKNFEASVHIKKSTWFVCNSVRLTFATKVKIIPISVSERAPTTKTKTEAKPRVFKLRSKRKEIRNIVIRDIIITI